MSTVVYIGPSDEADPTNTFEVPGDAPGEVHSFRQGVTVTDVPADVIDVLRATDGHEFDFGDGAPKRAKAEVQDEARDLGVEFTDRTTVSELEDAIAAKRAEDGS